MEYYDIFFNNPLAEYEDTSQGVLVTFPGPKEALVCAVVDLGEKRLHCLVTDAQLDQTEADNVAYKFFADEDLDIKNEGKPAHVFNPAGVVSRRNGKKYITRVNSDTEEELGS